MSSLGGTEGLSVFALLITPDYAFYPSNYNEGPFNINAPEQVSVTAIHLVLIYAVVLIENFVVIHKYKYNGKN